MYRVMKRLLARALAEDSSLVVLPAGVGTCRVFRNVMTMEEENRIYEEYGRVLEREGQDVILEGSNKEDKVIKHTYLEIHGHKDFTEVKSSSRREIKNLPGLTWSPTLMRILQDLGRDVVPFVADTGRVVEHRLPGYELHLENPVTGPSFVYFNLLCDTVLEFDDEPTQRKGQVYLPARSFMYVSDEARWGFRFGELSEDTHVFRFANGSARRIEMDLRLSIQLWKLSTNLLDARVLQERLEEGLVQAEKQRAAEEETRRRQRQQSVEKAEDEKEALEALQTPGANRFNIQLGKDKATSAEALQALMGLGAAGETTSGGGALGGDLAETGGASAKMMPSSLKENDAMNQEKVMTAMQRDYSRHKDQFSHVYGVLQEMKAVSDAGQPLNDMWLKQKVTESTQADPRRDAAEGFDPGDIEGTWDRTDARARFYKAKLKTMDYDGTAFLNSTMPDVSKDAPLDMRATVRKIAPLVKDGESILASLPGGQGR